MHAATVVLARDGRELARWPLTTADLTAVEALARAQLNARRHGYEIIVRAASPALAGLLRLVGFAGLVVQVLGEAEGCEQAGIDEVVVTDDPVA